MADPKTGTGPGQELDGIQHTGIACPRCESYEIVRGEDGMLGCGGSNCEFVYGDVAGDEESCEFAARALSSGLDQLLALKFTKSQRKLINEHLVKRAQARFEALYPPDD